LLRHLGFSALLSEIMALSKTTVSSTQTIKILSDDIIAAVLQVQ
jgi:hypothetical protein